MSIVTRLSSHRCQGVLRHAERPQRPYRGRGAQRLVAVLLGDVEQPGGAVADGGQPQRPALVACGRSTPRRTRPSLSRATRASARPTSSGLGCAGMRRDGAAVDSCGRRGGRGRPRPPGRPVRPDAPPSAAAASAAASLDLTGGSSFDRDRWMTCLTLGGPGRPRTASAGRLGDVEYADVIRRRLGRVGIWSSAWATIQRTGDPSGLRRGGRRARRPRLRRDLARRQPGGRPRRAAAGGRPPGSSSPPASSASGSTRPPTSPPSGPRSTAPTPAGSSLGLGVSHAQTPPGYERPYGAMRDYLTALDDADEPVPAIGPRPGRARAEDAGAVARPGGGRAPVPGHRRAHRRGPATSSARTRCSRRSSRWSSTRTADRAARRRAAPTSPSYLALPNYPPTCCGSVSSADDLRDGGSDRLVDAVFALGDADASPAGSASSSPPAPTTSRCRWSPTTPAPRSPRAAWRPLARTLPVGG